MERTPTFGVTFQAKRIPPLGYGRFRGQGVIRVAGHGLQIDGRHLLPLQTRVLIVGLVLALLATTGFLITGTLVLPSLLGLVILYLLADRVILKRDELAVPWSRVRSFIAGPHLVAIDIDLPDEVTPVVFRSPDAAQIVTLLREHVPDRETAARGKAQVSTGLGLIIIWLTVVITFLVGSRFVDR